MDHTEAVNQLAVEKYLLGKLGPEERNSFEEHFFTCEECAADLRATSLFIAQAKKELAQPSAAPAVAETPKRFFNFAAIFRPAFVVPAMAILLVTIGFQNIVIFPRLKQEVAVSSHPQILPSVNLVDGGSRGAEIRTVAATAHQPFLLFVDVPTEARFTRYQCLLYAPSGKLVWQIPVTTAQAANTVSIQVPAESAEAGVNTLVVQGIPSQGASVDVVKYRFLLQLR
jgi:hypothetical protein